MCTDCLYDCTGCLHQRNGNKNQNICMLGLIRENVYVLRLWDELNNGWRYNHHNIYTQFSVGRVTKLF
jgi:hypothetical protein